MSNTALQKRNQAKTEDQNIVNVPDRGRGEQQPQHQPQQATWYTPLVDIAETGESFVFQADLPGVRAEDLDIRFDNGTLTIEGRVQPRGPAAGGAYLWREYGVGHFHRSFSLAAPIDVDAIKAELANGVLTLTVPKAASARSRKIEIQSS